MNTIKLGIRVPNFQKVKIQGHSIIKYHSNVLNLGLSNSKVAAFSTIAQSTKQL